MKFGMVVRREQIARVFSSIWTPLASADAHGRAKRRRGRTMSRVPDRCIILTHMKNSPKYGVRPHQHLPAAPVVLTSGIWIHGCIDGYSRYIVYLKAASSKLSEVVRLIFLDGMKECGWASRCRWDQGRENIGAIMEQIKYNYKEDNPASLYRGSAITVSARNAMCCVINKCMN
jgi:hypothetical protein